VTDHDASDQQADLLKVGWTSARDTVEGSDSHFTYVANMVRFIYSLASPGKKLVWTGVEVQMKQGIPRRTR